MVRRDDDACALCDHYREEERERKSENEVDHKTMWNAIGQKLDKWVLIVLIPSAAAGFWYFGQKVDRVGEAHTAAMTGISTTINKIESQQAVMLYKVDRLEKQIEAK